MNRICIAGRPNVGKSTLFNRIYGRRYAITDRIPGVTRDAVAVETEFAGRTILLVDTGGIGEGEKELDQQVYSRSRAEIGRADVVLLLVDVEDYTGEDDELLSLVRQSGRPAVLVVNKVDNEAREQLVSEFWQYGIPHVIAISAAHGLGIDDLEETIMALLPPEKTVQDGAETALEGDGDEAPTEQAGLDRQVGPGHHAGPDHHVGPDNHPGSYHQAETDPQAETDRGGAKLPDRRVDSSVRLAILGRPNTGKSSLLNRLVGEERAIVSELAGTTRDVVEARFSFRDTSFLVIDTAGIRRRSKVHESVEYYSVQRALDTIDMSELVILVIDAVKGLTDQDKKIAARIAEKGRGVVVALNKWDLLDDSTGNKINAITDRINFMFPVFQHVPILPTSALHGTGIDDLLNRLVHIRGELNRRIETGPLNQALQRWLAHTPPPSGKKPIKLRYITQVSTNPVRFVLFVNRKKEFPEFYLRFVQNRIRDEFGFHHIPFFIEVRQQ